MAALQQSCTLALIQVNVVIECYDIFKSRFPFSKPVIENNNYGNNAWDSLYNSKKQPINNNNNYGGSGSFNNTGWGSNPNTNANTGWGNNQANNGWNTNANNWGGSNTNTWGSSSGWNTTANNTWGNPPANNPPANNWGNAGGWGGTAATGGMGGMGGIMGSNATSSIASAQKLVGKQKQTLQQMNGQYLKVIEKVQVLDIAKQSLESEESYLRTENFEMTNFLKENESASQISSMSSIVKPKDLLSEQILDLMSGIKAREECELLL
jgi:hypothetical protein